MAGLSVTLGVGLPMGLLYDGNEEAYGAVRLGGEPLRLSVAGYAVWTAARLGAGEPELEALKLPAGVTVAGVCDDLRQSGLAVDWDPGAADGTRQMGLQALRPVPLGTAVGQTSAGGEFQIGTTALDPVVEVSSAGYALWVAFDGRRSLEGGCVDAADALSLETADLRAVAWALVPLLCRVGVLALDRLTAPTSR